MDTQSRIKTNICHCPKTEGGFRGEGRALEPGRRGLKNGQMHQNVFSLPLPVPGTLVYWRRETSLIRLAGNESWDPIHTDAIIFSLPYLGVNGAECFLSGSDNPHTHPGVWARRLELGRCGNERRRTCSQNKPKMPISGEIHKIWMALFIKYTFWLKQGIIPN